MPHVFFPLKKLNEWVTVVTSPFHSLMGSERSGLFTSFSQLPLIEVLWDCPRSSVSVFVSRDHVERSQYRGDCDEWPKR